MSLRKLPSSAGELSISEVQHCLCLHNGCCFVRIYWSRSLQFPALLVVYGCCGRAARMGCSSVRVSLASRASAYVGVRAKAAALSASMPADSDFCVLGLVLAAS